MGGVAVIPGHITALYVFAVLNLMALFHISLVEADIMVLDSTNTTLETMPDMPAQFGPGFPSEGLWGHILHVDPHDGCEAVSKAPEGGNWIAIMARNNCNFDTKVYNAQKANYSAAIVYNIQSDDLVPMGRSGDKMPIYIPSCFIGSTDADYLIKHFSGSSDYSVVIDNRSPFNFNINYLVPFAIVVGICFVLMVVFMVARWVLDYRKRRKSRLSKDALKKIPIKKFKKGDHYDVCAICLDEYEEGEKLRILPCSHAYHMKCIDPWLTKSKRNCPVCKRKVIPGDNSDSDSESDDESEGAGENTPLLTASNSNMNTHHTDNYARSGLPASMRGAANSVSSGSDSDSESDPALSSSYQSQSLAQVHASPRSGRIGYGATAEATPATEYISASPSGSAHSREGYESLDGAVGGEVLSTAVEVDEDLSSTNEGPGDFVDDHFCGDDNEMSGLISGGEAEDDKKESFLVKILGRKSPKRSQDGDEA